MSDNAKLIGPLTAEEWCSLRLGTDDDPLQCCAVTSNLRDGLFVLLRMGGGLDWASILADEWRAMDRHGWPDGTLAIDKIRAFYGAAVAAVPEAADDDDVDVWMSRQRMQAVLVCAARQITAEPPVADSGEEERAAIAADLRRWAGQVADGDWPPTVNQGAGEVASDV